MPSGIDGIDHLVIAVCDLEEARLGWVRLGFAVTPRGRHRGQGTANYCIMFDRDYLELLGFAAPEEHALRLREFLGRREGAMAVAFAVDRPIEAVAAALAARGLHPGEPRALGRLIDLPEGSAEARFALLDLPPEETPALDSFLCRHLTPELLRRPEWLAHPNGAVGLRSITVVAAETASLPPAYDRLFGIHEVTTTDAVISVRSGPHRLLFATPDDFATMHPGIDLAADLPLPGIAAIELRVTSRAATARWLAQHQIPVAELPDARLALPADAANGTIVFFAEG